MKTKHIIITVLVILFGSLITYRIIANKKSAKPGGAARSGGPAGKGGNMPPMRVNGVIVKADNFSNALSVSGSMEANQQVEIKSEVSGLVTGIYFQEGGYVRKGQLLVKINDRELQAQLSQALTRQKLAAQNEYRAGMLLKKEAISREEYDIALADLKTLQSQTQLIRAQLTKTQVRAPFSGKIGLKSISNGEYVTPTSTIANLVSLDPINIIFSIPEKYSGMIKEGANLSFTVAGSSHPHIAKIFAIEPSIEATTRTLQLKARAINSDGQLLPGAFAKIDLPLSVTNNAILIPTQAIVPVLKGKKVFISFKGKAKEVMIETGARTEDKVLVTSGLSIGDTVLTTGTMALKPETPVKVKVID